MMRSGQQLDIAALFKKLPAHRKRFYTCVIKGQSGSKAVRRAYQEIQSGAEADFQDTDRTCRMLLQKVQQPVLQEDVSCFLQRPVHRMISLPEIPMQQRIASV